MMDYENNVEHENEAYQEWCHLELPQHKIRSTSTWNTRIFVYVLHLASGHVTKDTCDICVQINITYYVIYSSMV